MANTPESLSGVEGSPAIWDFDTVITQWALDYDNGDHKYDFATSYRNSKNLNSKFDVARALINSGQYPDPISLIDSFVPSTLQATPEVEIMRSQLKGMQLRKTADTLQTHSKEAKDLEVGVSAFIDTNPILSELRGVVPIHILGAITTAFMFEGISDEAKLEELRRYTTKALLRPYLGDILYKRATGAVDTSRLISLLPDKILENVGSAMQSIIHDFIVQETRRYFIDGEDAGFAKLQEMHDNKGEGLKKNLYKNIIDEYREIADVEIPENFKRTITSKNKEIQFPNFMQKIVLHDFLKTKRKLFNGGTGSTKTATSFMCMESSGAEKVTIFGPATARNTWPKQAKEHFIEGMQPDVFRVQSEKQLDDPRVESAKYVYVGGDLLARALKNPVAYEQLKAALIDRRQTDGIIMDESDEFRNHKSSRTKTLTDLVTTIERNHKAKSDKALPMLALTATPIASELSNLDTTMGLLYPDRFSLPDETVPGKTTFSMTTLRNPKQAFTLLFGERLIIQWSQKDMFHDVQEIDPQVYKLQISPSERALYDWVKDQKHWLKEVRSQKPEDQKHRFALKEIEMLSKATLNPELIRSFAKQHDLIPESHSFEEQVEILNDIYREYKEWCKNSEEEIRVPFGADWIVQHGHKNFFLECFFDTNFASGIESLVWRSQVSQEIKLDWEEKTEVSQKYEFIKKMLKETFVKNEDGEYVPNKKIFIVSPILKKGFTRWMDEEKKTRKKKEGEAPKKEDTVFEDDTFSLYERIRGIWCPNIPGEMFYNIDGARNFLQRDQAARKWKTEGKENAVIVATLKSVSESMDFSIENTDRNGNIEKAVVIYLGWPWGYDNYAQQSGRFVRPKQEKPAEFIVLEADGTIDNGFNALVRRKYLLMQMALAGVDLDPEDQAFYEGTSASNLILNTENVVGQQFIRDIISRVQGIGSGEFLKNIKGREAEWAKAFFDEGKDEFRQVGHNAEMVKNIILNSNPRKVLSIGAGTCLMARKISETARHVEVDNLDLIPDVLKISKSKYDITGQNFIGNAVDLRRLSSLEEPLNINQSIANETYDAVDCSFMIDMTSMISSDAETINDVERVKVLSEINRILKPNGRVVFALPKSSFENYEGGKVKDDTEGLRSFVYALEKHFGFEVEMEYTGRTSTTDTVPLKRVGWVITAKKVDNVDTEGLDLYSLRLTSDNPYGISTYKGERFKPANGDVDYPVYSPKEFEIYNPLTEHVELLDKSGSSTDADSYWESESQLKVATPPSKSVMKEVTDRTLTGPADLPILELIQPRLFSEFLKFARVRVPQALLGEVLAATRGVLTQNKEFNEDSDILQPQNYPELLALVEMSLNMSSLEQAS